MCLGINYCKFNVCILYVYFVNKSFNLLILFQIICCIWIAAYLVLGIALYQSVSHDLLTLDSALVTLFSLLIGRYSHDHLESTVSIGWRVFVVGFTICAAGFMTVYVSIILTN